MEPNALMREYLAEIYELQQGRPFVSLLWLAKRLNVEVSAVVNITKELGRAGYLTNWPFQGVTLTDDGRAIALAELAQRRLDDA